MLMIERQLPIKKMALYGSLAVLIGFTGTYAILNELFPTDDPNLAGSSLNSQDATRANVSNQIPTKENDDNSNKDAAAPLKDNGLVIREDSVPQQQTLRTTPTTKPAATPAPVNTPSTTTVAPVAPATSGGSVAAPTSPPVIMQPTPTPSTAPIISPPVITNQLQNTVQELNNTVDTKILP